MVFTQCHRSKGSQTQKAENYLTPFMCNYQKIQCKNKSISAVTKDGGERRAWL